jgi:pimeloyl-ACP methyl ester carboxylesterase
MPQPLDRKDFDEWGAVYLDSDANSRARSPASVRVPNGPVQDIAAAWSGELAYDPRFIQAPVAILRGEWDSVVNDADARWLFDSLQASPVKRDVKLSRGTHLMHLESGRFQLHREARCFLEGQDTYNR